MTISKETIEEMKLAMKADEPTETKRWNIQDHLKTNEERVEYLRAALEEKDKEYYAIALMDIAQSLGLGATIYVKHSTLGQCSKCGKTRPLHPYARIEDGKFFCDSFWCHNCIQKDKK